MADLITIETYKQAKGLTSSKEDERLGIIVNSVNQLVKTYCGNSFVDYVDTPYEEYFSPDLSINTLQLTEMPLLEITEVSERTATTEDYQVLTDLQDYAANKRVDTVVRIGANFPIGIEAVKVVYTAGYATLPADLTLALVDLVSYYLNGEHKTTRQLSGASMTNVSTSTLVGNVDFPDHIKRVLDLYRQIL